MEKLKRPFWLAQYIVSILLLGQGLVYSSSSCWFHHTHCTPLPSATWSAWVWSEDSMAWSMTDQWQNTEWVQKGTVTVTSNGEFGALCYSSMLEPILTDTFKHTGCEKLYFYTLGVCAVLELFTYRVRILSKNQLGRISTYLGPLHFFSMNNNK